jgi:hypothetical protein
MLAKVVDGNQRDWDEHLPFVLLAYRAAVQESTGFSPHVLMTGREPLLPVDLLYGQPPTGRSINPSTYVQSLQEKLWATHELARESMLKASTRQKRYYDLRGNLNQYAEGDLVWLHDTRRRKGLSPKLQKRWDGPYTIVSRISDLNYEVRKPGGRKMTIVHHNRLKPYYGKPRGSQTREEARIGDHGPATAPDSCLPAEPDEEPPGETEPEVVLVPRGPMVLPPRMTRRGRVSRKPKYYGDYVFYGISSRQEDTDSREG